MWPTNCVAPVVDLPGSSSGSFVNPAMSAQPGRGRHDAGHDLDPGRVGGGDRGVEVARVVGRPADLLLDPAEAGPLDQAKDARLRLAVQVGLPAESEWPPAQASRRRWRRR